MKAGARNFPTLVQQADGDGKGVGKSKGDHTHRDKRGEGGGAAEVNEAEEHLHHCDENQRPDRNAKSLINAGPDAGKRHCIITRKCPGTA